MRAGGRGLAHRDVDRAAVRVLEPCEDAEQGRLPDAGRAEQQEVAVVGLAVDAEAPATIIDIEKNPGDYMKVVVRVSDD